MPILWQLHGRERYSNAGKRSQIKACRFVSIAARAACFTELSAEIHHPTFSIQVLILIKVGRE
jgi:hypothetical protein